MSIYLADDASAWDAGQSHLTDQADEDDPFRSLLSEADDPLRSLLSEAEDPFRSVFAEVPAAGSEPGDAFGGAWET